MPVTADCCGVVVGAEHAPDCPRPRPLWMKLDMGLPLTFGERAQSIANTLLRAAQAFRWRGRMTPRLRAECVDRVIRAGAQSDAWAIKRQAQELADYIAKGESL